MSPRVLVLALAICGACGGIAVIDDTSAEESDVGRACGGKEGSVCGPNTYCERAEGVDCLGVGVCRERPTSCSEDGAEVCACDGYIYPNECMAHATGVEAVSGAWCLMQATARTHIAGDRLTFMHQDVAAGVCLRLVATSDASPAYDVDISAPWQPISVTAYNTTDSCLRPDVLPPAPEIAASTATGSARLERYDTHGLLNHRCRLDVEIRAELPAASWLDGPIVISSPETPVEGPCPP